MPDGKHYPSEDSLGEDCRFWQGINTDPKKHIGGLAVGCFYPKREMEGRLSCEGIVDDVCLFLKSGRPPSSLTPEQIAELRYRVPSTDNREIPPGDIY